MRPEVVVHHLEQAKSVLRVAGQAGIDIQLRSAPGAVASAGVGYLRALGDEACHELLIDCGDDAGLAMAALRAGCRKLVFSGSDDERRRLEQMAERSGAGLRGPADRCPPCLVTSPEEDDAVFRTWLDARFGT